MTPTRVVPALLLGLAACASEGGAAAPALTDVTDGSGLGFRRPLTSELIGVAVAVGDLDSDGLPEIALASARVPLRVYRNLGELRFDDATSELGLPDELFATALSIVDLDGDGVNELLVGGADDLRLFARGPGGALEDHTASVGLEGLGVPEPSHILPVDVDADGRLDLYVSAHGGADRLLVWRDDGYRDVTADLLDTREDLSFVATWYDHDGDGAPDLYVATDQLIADFGLLPEHSDERRSERADRLWRNRGPGDDGEPRFEDATADRLLDIPRSSMGGLPADLDRDGWLDLFMSDLGRNHVLLGGPGAPRYATAELGLDEVYRDDGGCPDVESRYAEWCLLVSWGAAHVDLDLDGSDELVVVSGGLDPDFRGPEPLRLYVRRGDRFEAVDPGLPLIHGRALAAADLDGDRDVDLVIATWAGPVTVVRNEADAPGRALSVTLRGAVSNPRGAGALVELERADGSRVVRAQAPGGVLQSSIPAVSHFGLGDQAAVSLTVRWPSGFVQRVVAPTGDVVVEEPLLVKTSADRAPADGESTVEVVVTPHDADAAPLGAGHSVEIEATAGSWAADVTDLGDGRYSRALTAPDSPAVAVLRVSIDGEDLKARPRVSFQ